MNPPLFRFAAHDGLRRAAPGLLVLAGVLLSAAGCSDRADAPMRAAAASTTAAAGPHAVAMARGKVEVTGGLLDLMAPQDGTVESLAVAEGDEVRRGQVLLRLASDAARQDVAVAEAELQLAQARQQAQAARLPAARQLVQRLDEAARAGAADLQRHDDAVQTRQDIAAAVAVAAADVQVARQRLAQARGALARRVLAAPQDGTVVRVLAQPGAHADAQGGRPALVLLPHRPLQVRAELNESFAAAVRPGMRVSVAADTGAAGRPAAGRVLRLSPVYGASRLDDETTPPRVGVRVLDCFIAFDQTPDLRVGQDVRVTFHE